jgi:hypothetical protein
MYQTVSVLLFVSMHTMPIHMLGVLVDKEMSYMNTSFPWSPVSHVPVPMWSQV